MSLAKAEKQRKKSHRPLEFVPDSRAGITRISTASGFVYRSARGKPVVQKSLLKRIRSLAIPPAWTDVWICPSPDGHIQATGRDAKGRKQYIYHPDFRSIRDANKYEHLIEFAEVLPGLRRHLKRQMMRKHLSRERVLATVVYLLDQTLIRVGNADYAKKNHSYGITTFRNPHVSVSGPEVRFHFKGKSGKTWNVRMQDRRVAKVIKACQDLPGQQLFQYLDTDGTVQNVTSSDVNQYLREVTGRDITAKDFRTWAGTFLAACELNEFPPYKTEREAKANIRAVTERVAARLGNTPTICRNCYIHPDIFTLYLQGNLNLKTKSKGTSTRSDNMAEAAVLSLLRKARKSRNRSNDKNQSSLAVAASLAAPSPAGRSSAA